ncbi:MAG TPA: F0F1 ATP synthase subunit B [Tepidisphaeraceae bacterium]|nr:F0F1 ATP synthase subunit B [Tepidisphaeraceae bacterium]
MLKRIILALALAGCLNAPALAQDHGGTHQDATGKAQDVHTAGQGAANTAAVEADHGGEAHAVKPELLPDPTSRETWLQAMWVIIIFVALLAILYPTAWKSVLAGLKAREERIRRDIADAEAARARAEGTLREYNQQLASAEGQIREMLAKAQADGERIGTNLRMQAQQESEEIKNRATRDIEAAKDQALAEVYERTAELATAVAEKILRRNLNADDQRDLVSRSLEQVQTIGRQ